MVRPPPPVERGPVEYVEEDEQEREYDQEGEICATVVVLSEAAVVAVDGGIVVLVLVAAVTSTSRGGRGGDGGPGLVLVMVMIVVVVVVGIRRSRGWWREATGCGRAVAVGLPSSMRVPPMGLLLALRLLRLLLLLLLRGSP